MLVDLPAYKPLLVINLLGMFGESGDQHRVKPVGTLDTLVD